MAGIQEVDEKDAKRTIQMYFRYLIRMEKWCLTTVESVKFYEKHFRWRSYGR